MKHIRPFSGCFAVILLVPVIACFYPLAYNHAIRLFIDELTVTTDFSYYNLSVPIAFFLGAQLLMCVVWRLGNIAEWRAAPYIKSAILEEAYSLVQARSYAFFQKHPVGLLTSKIKDLIQGYDQFWKALYHGVLDKLLRSIVNLFALLAVNIYLGGFMILMSLSLGIITFQLSKKLNQLSFLESESFYRVIKRISDNLLNFTSILYFSMQKEELVNLRNKIDQDFLKKNIKVYKYNFKVELIMNILYSVMFTFMMFYLIHLRKMNLVTIGDIAFVFGISLVISSDIWYITKAFQEVAKSLGKLKSSMSILYKTGNTVKHEKTVRLIKSNTVLEINDLFFSFSTNQVLKGIDLSIKKGEKIGVVGKSGVGKSTLVNLILGNLSPSSGVINLYGSKITDIPEEVLMKLVALIPQDITLFNRSIKENLCYGVKTKNKRKIFDITRRISLSNFINSLPDKYQSCVGERGVKLSKGQRQQIAIGRVFLKNSPIIILDEATSALDSETEQHIQTALHSLFEDKSKTVIAIAHRLSTLKDMDIIIVLDNGKIIEKGTHDELLQLKNSFYRKLCKLQRI